MNRDSMGDIQRLVKDEDSRLEIQTTVPTSKDQQEGHDNK
jgi:hypothetical protein